MQNIYCKELQLPDLFVQCYQDINNTLSLEKVLPISDINIEFRDWLASLNIGLDNCSRFFSAFPYHKYTLHKDISYASEVSKRVTDCVKINIIYNSRESRMKWYSLKPDKAPRFIPNKVGEKLRIYNEEDCDVLFEAETNGSAYLINGMVIHTLINGNSTRHCYSMPLVNLTTRVRLTWDEANAILGPYMSNHQIN
jgi:hypothetical protein